MIKIERPYPTLFFSDVFAHRRLDGVVSHLLGYSGRISELTSLCMNALLLPETTVAAVFPSCITVLEYKREKQKLETMKGIPLRILVFMQDDLGEFFYIETI
jgi:hypothetical protein